MPRINKVTLEILRHGPPHNQLLSPLTEYLALCGNHDCVSVRVPYEQSHFLARHRSLTYGEGGPASAVARQDREMALRITAQEIGKILAGVPGLNAELSRAKSEDELTHLEIVLSASELALLPFELADAASGFPGAGQPLTLQTEVPLCLTRRVRWIDNDHFSWPTDPKILCAIASPPDYRSVPAAKHLAAFKQVLDPWIRRKVGEERADSLDRELAAHLTILPQASAAQIAKAIKQGDYTHLHILAHGVEYKDGYDRRFGLALHDHRDPARTDLVSASRLATIVRPYERHDARLAAPAVVTLASCHGAGQGSVVGAGSSIAHALHEAGVPLVVSSQFPLSFAGSVLMVRQLYHGMLWGNDPRTSINDLRRQLKSQVSKTHDWASLVTYAALPAKIDRQLADLKFWQAKRAIEAAFYYLESDRDVWEPKRQEGESPQVDDTADADRSAVYRQLLERLARARIRLDELVEHDDANRVETGRPLLPPAASSWVRGLLASTAKREAEVRWLQADPRERTRWSEVLRQARDWYGKAFEADRTQAWALAQEVALSSVLARRRELGAWKERLRYRWQAAYGLLHRDLEGSDRQRTIWAHSNLIEVHMIWLLICGQSDQPLEEPFQREVERARKLVRRHLTEMLEMVGERDPEIRSRRRQVERYAGFFLKTEQPAGAEPDVEAGLPVDQIPRERVVELAWEVLDKLKMVSGFGDA